MMASSRLLADARSLFKLAGPIILSQVAMVLMGLVDTVMSGQAGATEQAVVALGVSLWIPLFITAMSIVQAVSPVIAHHVGAGDGAAVARDAREGMWLAAWISVVPLAVMPFTPHLLTWAGVAPALAVRTGVFLWGIMLGLPAALVYRALAFYSSAIHETMPLMVLSFVSLGCNALFNWLLIGGHFGLPAMGGAGCGWATGIGMWVGLFGLVAWTAMGPAYRPYFVWHGWSWPHRAAQWRLLKLGLPMGGAALAEVSAFCSVAILIGRFGPVQIAAHSIALNFASIVFMVPMGLSAAMTILVGNALGGGDTRGAHRIAWAGMVLAWLVALAAMGPMVVGRDLITAVYSSDPAVRALAASLLWFAVFWLLFDCTQVCAIGALRGYKVTVAPMVMMLLAFWGVGIPLGTWLGYHGWPGQAPMQVYGFWVGLVTGLVLVSIGLLVALRSVSRPVARAG